ncbi:MAG TPA: sensor histidine kinase [Solirubrobacterales bacterium]|nr:sensor histidine kinase [Solirubrobacterales bacterium]
MRDGLRALWNEPRPPQPPAPVWRDRALVAAVVSWSVVETLLREDLAWGPVLVTVCTLIALSLLWRRAHPLGAVAAGFGTLIALDVARILAAVDTTGLLSIAAVLVLPYSLFRWGAGREAAVGLGLILAWLPITFVAEPQSAGEMFAGYGFFLSSAAWGAAIRFHATVRVRDVEQAKLRQRSELARELHDSVGHHVSAIAVQAQAGRALAASDTDRALAVLATIEEAASRTLEEMRAMVGILRDGNEAELAPPPGLADIERLAHGLGEGPRVDVHLSGDFAELSPSVGAALYRIAQESVTNGLRHARHATRITVRVADEGDEVRLTVRDDGEAGAGARTSSGHGLAGMSERATLLGGTVRAGRGPGERGWTVDAVLPKGAR